MRNLKRNKELLKYSLQDGEVPVYEEYTDDNGKTVKYETGNYELGYSEPVEFFGNIAFSSGEVEIQEFGVDTSSYDAVLILEKDELPITETALVWYQSEVSYKDTDKTVIEPKSADYRVKAIKQSKNQLKVLLERNTK